jgi:hypothetical protein
MPYLRRLLPVVFVLLTVLPAAAHAQVAGFKAGMSFSTLTSEGEATGSVNGFTGGLFVRFGMGGAAVQPELLYVEKGVSRPGQDVRLDYIEIPLLLMLPLGRGATVPFLYSGAAASFEVGCRLSDGADCFENAVGDDEELSGAGIGVGLPRRRHDIGAIIGGGVHLPLGPGALTLEGRYNFGLVDLRRAGQGEAVRNRSGAVFLSYAIFIGR